ncbi:hypothetical protein [Hoeflea alexandrii]|uniref:hypothetical protein n=1 Tax=Hoeflea alexandrii TaxID=288436 RepID=UPI002D1E3BA9|nr:hypothetical protein [Hoeflea alexandrii]
MNTKHVSIIVAIVFDVKNSRTNSYCDTRLTYSPVDIDRAESEVFMTFWNST